MKNLVKFNAKQIIEVVMASVVVQQAPDLINKFLFKTNPLTGLTLKAAGVGAAILAGKVFKKESMGNYAVALVAADLANELVTGAIQGDTGLIPGIEGAPKIEPAINIKMPAHNIISDYGILNDYLLAPMVNRNYADYY